MFFAFWAIFVHLVPLGIAGLLFYFVIPRQAFLTNHNRFIFHILSTRLLY